MSHSDGSRATWRQNTSAEGHLHVRVHFGTRCFPVLDWPAEGQNFNLVHAPTLYMSVGKIQSVETALQVCIFIQINRNEWSENSTCLHTYTHYYLVHRRVEFSAHSFPFICMKMQSDTHVIQQLTHKKCTSGYGNFIKKPVDRQTNCPFLTKNDQPRTGTHHNILLN